MFVLHRSLENKENFSFECQGEMEIRPGSQMTTYFLERPKAKLAAALPVPIASTTPPAKILSMHRSKHPHCVLS